MHPGGFKVASAIKDRLATIRHVECQPSPELREVVEMIDMVVHFDLPSCWRRRALIESHTAYQDDGLQRLYG